MREEPSLTITTHDAGETAGLGYAIGKTLLPGAILALTGDLGSGKTCFTGGLARGIGVPEEYVITSPTFTLAAEYPGRCSLCHLDVYRLSSEAQLDDLGFDEMISGSAVVVIEWADRIENALPAGVIFVHFEYLDENRRIVRIGAPEDCLRRLEGAIITEVNHHGIGRSEIRRDIGRGCRKNQECRGKSDT